MTINKDFVVVGLSFLNSYKQRSHWRPIASRKPTKKQTKKTVQSGTSSPFHHHKLTRSHWRPIVSCKPTKKQQKKTVQSGTSSPFNHHKLTRSHWRPIVSCKPTKKQTKKDCPVRYIISLQPSQTNKVTLKTSSLHPASLQRVPFARWWWWRWRWLFPQMRIWGEWETIHSPPALSLCQDQSTVAQRAEIIVAKCSLTSCV